MYVIPGDLACILTFIQCDRLNPDNDKYVSTSALLCILDLRQCQ